MPFFLFSIFGGRHLLTLEFAGFVDKKSKVEKLLSLVKIFYKAENSWLTSSDYKLNTKIKN